MGKFIAPLINGHAYSFASVEVSFNDTLIFGVLSVNYADEMSVGLIYGSSPNKIGRTPGHRKLSASIDILKREWDILREALGQSFGRKAFDVLVQYAEFAQPITSDKLAGCRITKIDASNTNGADATALKLDLDPDDILWGASGLSLDRRFG